MGFPDLILLNYVIESKRFFACFVLSLFLSSLYDSYIFLRTSQTVRVLVCRTRLEFLFMSSRALSNKTVSESKRASLELTSRLLAQEYTSSSHSYLKSRWLQNATMTGKHPSRSVRHYG